MNQVYSEKKDCCGCGACLNACPKKAISMVADEKGFAYPVIHPSLCIDCNICRKVCNFNSTKEPNIFEIFGCKNKSSDIRRKSTSGGMFTALSDNILQKGGVVYGAVFNEDFKVVHIRAEKETERDKMRGSKYVQSDLGAVFATVKKDLKAGREVLFTGTPCQIAGLKGFLNKNISEKSVHDIAADFFSISPCPQVPPMAEKNGKESDLDYENLYLCDLICHGVPSPFLWRDYLSFLESRYNEKAKQVFFRDKDFAGNKSGIKIVFDTRVYKNDFYTDDFFSLYFGEYISRECCYHCPFTNLNRPSDITIGDFWGIEDFRPEFFDHDGISLVLINSLKGKRLFNAISDKINWVKSAENECLKRQPQLKSPSVKNAKFDVFWADYMKKGFQYVLKKYTAYGKIFRMKKQVENALFQLLKKTKLLKFAKKLKFLFFRIYF